MFDTFNSFDYSKPHRKMSRGKLYLIVGLISIMILLSGTAIYLANSRNSTNNATDTKTNLLSVKPKKAAYIVYYPNGWQATLEDDFGISEIVTLSNKKIDSTVTFKFDVSAARTDQAENNVLTEDQLKEVYDFALSERSAAIDGTIKSEKAFIFSFAGKGDKWLAQSIVYKPKKTTLLKTYMYPVTDTGVSLEATYPQSQKDVVSSLVRLVQKQNKVQS